MKWKLLRAIAALAFAAFPGLAFSGPVDPAVCVVRELNRQLHQSELINAEDRSRIAAIFQDTGISEPAKVNEVDRILLEARLRLLPPELVPIVRSKYQNEVETKIGRVLDSHFQTLGKTFVSVPEPLARTFVVNALKAHETEHMIQEVVVSHSHPELYAKNASRLGDIPEYRHATEHGAIATEGKVYQAIPEAVRSQLLQELRSPRIRAALSKGDFTLLERSLENSFQELDQFIQAEQDGRCYSLPCLQELYFKWGIPAKRSLAIPALAIGLGAGFPVMMTVCEDKSHFDRDSMIYRWICRPLGF